MFLHVPRHVPVPTVRTSTTRMAEDLVTEVVDVTGGSDDEDLVEVNKAGGWRDRW